MTRGHLKSQDDREEHRDWQTDFRRGAGIMQRCVMMDV